MYTWQTTSSFLPKDVISLFIWHMIYNYKSKKVYETLEKWYSPTISIYSQRRQYRPILCRNTTYQLSSDVAVLRAVLWGIFRRFQNKIEFGELWGLKTSSHISDFEIKINLELDYFDLPNFTIEDMLSLRHHFVTPFALEILKSTSYWSSFCMVHHVKQYNLSHIHIMNLKLFTELNQHYMEWIMNRSNAIKKWINVAKWNTNYGWKCRFFGIFKSFPAIFHGL